MPKSYKRDVSSKSGMLSHFSFSLALVLWLTFAIFFCSSFIFTYLYKIYTNSGSLNLWVSVPVIVTKRSDAFPAR